MTFTTRINRLLPYMARDRNAGMSWRELARTYQFSVNTCRKYLSYYQQNAQAPEEKKQDEATQKQILQLERTTRSLQDQIHSLERELETVRSELNQKQNKQIPRSRRKKK